MAEEKQKKRGGQAKPSSRADGSKRSSGSSGAKRSSSSTGAKRSSSRSGATRPPGRQNGRKPSAGKVAGAARREIAELMGRAPEAVSGVQRDGDSWIVTVEFLELERIPQSTDVLATYEVEIDENGELTGYRRTKRYVRSQAEG
jgi:Gas vesicle synthesis protein GvpO